MKARYRDAVKKLPGGKLIYDASRSVKSWVKRALIPSTIFENMGFTYLGPVDGHDVTELISLLRVAKDMKEPVLLHVLTHKGHGYAPAEAEPSRFHGIGRFDPVTGKSLSGGSRTFSQAFGDKLTELALQDRRICAITAAMPGGTGLLGFKEALPNRLFDVGIAEEHAVSMAGGLAKQGMVPVVAIYSTFLQRAYDQIMQDVAMLGLHVVFAVDRAGLVGEDGETHHGVYDIGFLRQVPGMQILCPASMQELEDMLEWAVAEHEGPVAVRYPRGGDGAFTDSCWDKNSGVAAHRHGKDCAIITYGTLVNQAIAAADILEEQGIEASVIRLTKIDPLPISGLEAVLSGIKTVFVIEEACTGSGIREALAWEMDQACIQSDVYGIDLGCRYVTHGDMKNLYAHYGLDGQSVAKFVQEVLSGEN